MLAVGKEELLSTVRLEVSWAEQGSDFKTGGNAYGIIWEIELGSSVITFILQLELTHVISRTFTDSH